MGVYTNMFTPNENSLDPYIGSLDSSLCMGFNSLLKLHCELNEYLTPLDIELNINGKFFTLGHKLQSIHDRIGVEFWEFNLNKVEEILKEMYSLEPRVTMS